MLRLLPLAFFLGNTWAQRPPKTCFARSKSALGLSSPTGTTFSDRNRILKSDFTSGMRISSFKGCRDTTNRFVGIQLTLTDSQKGGKSIVFRPVGDVVNVRDCDRVNLGRNAYITKMRVAWDNKGVSMLSIGTSEGVTAIFGRNTANSDSYEFSEAIQLVGLYGQYGSKSGVSSLGALIYKPTCAARAAEAAAQAAAEEERKSAEEYVPPILTNPDDISAQFSTFESFDLPDQVSMDNTPLDRFDQVGQVTEEPPSEDSDSSSSLALLGVVAAVVFAIVIATCAICYRFAKRRRKNAQVGATMKDEEEKVMSDAETPRNLLSRNVAGTLGEGLSAQATVATERTESEAKVALKQVDAMLVEERDGESTGLASALHAKRFEDINKSNPELQHPQESPRASICKDVEISSRLESSTIQNHRPSTIESMNTLSQQPALIEEQTHPPSQASQEQLAGAAAAANHLALDEESSMAIIAIRKDPSGTDLPKEYKERHSALMLPSIDENRGFGEVFMDETPDTRGILHKRFVEIIDSDDETNGNGTKVNRRKFMNQRDAFGDVEVVAPIVEAHIEEECVSPDTPSQY